ncbi:vitellogenin receptor-like [Cydia pomonella]|uniref:vitellogenin receptor-like n=1 Tax=Cydia pomonella TaxID=82600 RepID=UPI002ADE30F0|nr:vitellogenin receptor-like [Cydia pomonella]XP_061708863.1 vitellogenin receptor-like [Cydia pomonella]
MTLTDSFSGEIASATNVSTSNWDQLYCSHLWLNSNLRKTILNNVQGVDDRAITYCYTCRGKMRKYEIKSPRTDFRPNEHSTPNIRISKEISLPLDDPREDSICEDISRTEVFSCRRSSTKDSAITEVEINRCIPSISHQIDSSIRQKFTSYEPQPAESNPRRLRKSLKGVGCIVNFALTEPVKKRTQIQACSISVMIIAIVVISFVLVNFTTPSSTRVKVISTTVVPTQPVIVNKTSSAVTNIALSSAQLPEVVTSEISLTTEDEFSSTTENNSLINNVLSKIRKNIRTYPRNSNKSKESQKPKDIINRDIVSQSFCSCQTDEICMLNESSGTPDCRKAIDSDDPTGCGGLCALETEACQLVDRLRGVRVCRQLNLVTCSPQEWRCRNGLCVPAAARCDGAVQCYDKSDETHCECDLKKQFRCGHFISCFPNNKLCDGIIDCWDGFDELNCTTECPEDQFTCTDGQCILESRFCDGYADCPDGSDEPRGCDGGCSKHELQCRNRRCVSNSVRCDGQDNCGDATDEVHCS